MVCGVNSQKLCADGMAANGTVLIAFLGDVARLCPLRRPLHLGPVPLHHCCFRPIRKQRMFFAISSGKPQTAHFRLIRYRHFTAQESHSNCVQTDAKIGLGTIPPHSRIAAFPEASPNARFPPHCLRTAEHKEKIIGSKIGNFLPFPQANHFRNNPVFRQKQSRKRPGWSWSICWKTSTRFWNSYLTGGKTWSLPFTAAFRFHHRW